MIIIGADYHPGFQQIAFVDTDTGELHGSTRTGFRSGADREPIEVPGFQPLLERKHRVTDEYSADADVHAIHTDAQGRGREIVDVLACSRVNSEV